MLMDEIIECFSEVSHNKFNNNEESTYIKNKTEIIIVNKKKINQ
jgi:hypothetical protein